MKLLLHSVPVIVAVPALGCARFRVGHTIDPRQFDSSNSWVHP